MFCGSVSLCTGFYIVRIGWGRCIREVGMTWSTWAGGVDMPWAGGVTMPWAGGVDMPWAGGVTMPWAGGVGMPWAGGVDMPWAGGVTLPWAGGVAGWVCNVGMPDKRLPYDIMCMHALPVYLEWRLDVKGCGFDVAPHSWLYFIIGTVLHVYAYIYTSLTLHRI